MIHHFFKEFFGGKIASKKLKMKHIDYAIANLHHKCNLITVDDLIFKETWEELCVLFCLILCN